MSLAENVKKRRKEKKLTQEQLAEQAGVSRVYITQMETNVRNPNVQVVYLVAKALGCTLNDLYDENEKNAIWWTSGVVHFYDWRWKCDRKRTNERVYRIFEKSWWKATNRIALNNRGTTSIIKETKKAVWEPLVIICFLLYLLNRFIKKFH